MIDRQTRLQWIGNECSVISRITGAVRKERPARGASRGILRRNRIANHLTRLGDTGGNGGTKDAVVGCKVVVLAVVMHRQRDFAREVNTVTECNTRYLRERRRQLCGDLD